MTDSICEHCGVTFVPSADDKTEGQLCPKCLLQGAPIRIICAVNDDDPRYVPGLQNAADYIEDGMVYGSYTEFNHAEIAEVGDDWDQMPQLNASSIEALQSSINERTAFMVAFWKRHADLLVARDEAMNQWSQIKAGGVKPIIWPDVPDFRIIVEAV